MNITHDQLDTSIEKAINKYVNGKIDGVKKAVDETSRNVKELQVDFEKHVKVVQPIIEQFNDRKGFWNTLSKSSKNIAIVGSILGACGILWVFIKSHL